MSTKRAAANTIVPDKFPYEKFIETTGIDVTLIVPCYNEEKNVAATLDVIRQALSQLPHLAYEVIVIDDCSSDSTFQVTQEYIRQNPNQPVRCRRNPTNFGLARSFFIGAFDARGRYCRIVCGDNVETAENIVTILGEMGKADIVLPYHPHVEGKSALRRFLSSWFVHLVNFAGGYNVRYYNGAPLFRTFDVVRWQVEATGFGFQAELVTRLLYNGLSFCEVPIYPVERREGKARALVMRNWVSAGFTLVKIFARRMRHIIFEK